MYLRGWYCCTESYGTSKTTGLRTDVQSYYIRSPRHASFRLILLLTAFSLPAQQIRIDLGNKLGPLDIDHMALGQGGLSEHPMANDRVNEVRMLHPRIIRLFIQEYFDLLPAAGTYHWDTLDASVDNIRKTGATPLMNIDFKPRVLFPTVDERVVDPSSYEQWDELIYQM